MLQAMLIFIACYMAALAGVHMLERWLRRRMGRRGN